MDNTSKLVVGAILIAMTLALGWVHAAPTVVVNSPAAQAVAPHFGSNANGGNVTDYTAVNVEDGYYVDGVLIVSGNGAVTGTTGAFPGTVSIGGGVVTGDSESLATATTSIASLESPTATSTLFSVVCRGTGSTTASTVVLARGANTGATTTALASIAVGAGAQWTITASTSLDSVLTGTWAPNTFLNVSQNGGTGTFSPTGSCSALWLAA